jgi:beta-glucanase (GH16 family)
MRIHPGTPVARSATCALLASLTLLACKGSYQPAEGRRTNAPAPKGTVIFFDDFLGTSIDSTKWTVLDRLSDQANHEVNCVGPENVSVKDGLLEGVSRYEDRRCGDSLESPKTMHYTSWQIQQATQPFLYGTIEVRAKAPGGVGTWPTIWMLGFEWQASQPYTANTPRHRGPKVGWCEIDIAEFWQGGRRQVNTTVHYNKPGGLHIQELPFDATTRFMIYRLEWTRGSLIWSVNAEDGRGFRTLYSVRGSRRVPKVPMYLVIHTAIGGFGGGKPDPSTFPQTFQVDYVRVTQ